MQLDRNTNRGGRGKYALVNMRKVVPLLEDRDGNIAPESNPILSAIELLVKEGVVTFGNETPGDQFFVMKYKDKFTGPALRAYARAVSEHAHSIADSHPTESKSIHEYGDQMHEEATAAEKIGNRIPD